MEKEFGKLRAGGNEGQATDSVFIQWEQEPYHRDRKIAEALQYSSFQLIITAEGLDKNVIKGRNMWNRGATFKWVSKILWQEFSFSPFPSPFHLSSLFLFLYFPFILLPALYSFLLSSTVKTWQDYLVPDKDLPHQAQALRGYFQHSHC